MGLPQRLSDLDVLDPGSISDTLRCPVCMEFFHEPVFCGGRPCQHVFCRSCVVRSLERTSQCPSCRAEMEEDDLQPHLVIRNLLDEVHVRCSKGCGWTGRCDVLSAHLSECPCELLEIARRKLDYFADSGSKIAALESRIQELEESCTLKDKALIKTGSEYLSQKVQISDLDARNRRLGGEIARLRRQLADSQAEVAHFRGCDANQLACEGHDEYCTQGEPILTTTDDGACWADPEGFSADGAEALQSLQEESEIARKVTARMYAEDAIRECSSDVDKLVHLAKVCACETPPSDMISAMLAALNSYREDYLVDNAAAEREIVSAYPGFPPTLEGVEVAELAAWTTLATALIESHGQANHDSEQNITMCNDDEHDSGGAHHNSVLL